MRFAHIIRGRPAAMITAFGGGPREEKVLADDDDDDDDEEPPVPYPLAA